METESGNAISFLDVLVIRELSVHQDVNKIFETLEIDSSYEQTRHIGRDWKGRDMIMVKMRAFEGKLKVMRNKRKLAGRECFIENDMTRKERQIQVGIRRRATEETDKGHTVKIGYKKIQMNGKWEYYNNKVGKTGFGRKIQHPK
jgi:hypothetical protein